MAEKYDVVARVVSQKGSCGAGHKVGDKWLIAGKTPAGMCFSAFYAVYPTARVLMFGGTLPWEPDPDVTKIACPDAENPVIIELRRVRK
ncbi:MAG: TIGR04076 family protein [Chloroflexi bacterium]|nr:TIGR04076 family protein [Chloroflexota bacterium]